MTRLMPAIPLLVQSMCAASGAAGRERTPSPEEMIELDGIFMYIILIIVIVVIVAGADTLFHGFFERHIPGS